MDEGAENIISNLDAAFRVTIKRIIRAIMHSTGIISKIGKIFIDEYSIKKSWCTLETHLIDLVINYNNQDLKTKRLDLTIEFELFEKELKEVHAEVDFFIYPEEVSLVPESETNKLDRVII